MTFLHRSLVFGGLLLAAVSTFAENAPYVARVNGVIVSARALEQAVSVAVAGGQADTPALRKLLAQQLVAEELFWQEAKKQNLHTTPEAAHAAEQARRRHAIAQYIQRNVASYSPPDESVLRQRHERVVARLGEKEYRISLIQTRDLDALRDAAQRLANGTDFSAEARRVSQAPSAQGGGALNWISFPEPPVAGRTNGLPLPIAVAVTSMKAGAISSPILLDDKSWALIRLEETRATRVPAYAETRPVLLRGAKVQAAAESGNDLAPRLLKGARIEWSPAFEANAGEAR